MIDFAAMISDRSRDTDMSGIRRVFELGARLEDPINFSIGQPDFHVAQPLKEAAIEAIRADHNGYTLTQGAPNLREVVSAYLAKDVSWDLSGDEGAVLIS